MKRSLFVLPFLACACVSDAPKTAEDSAVAARAVAESTIAAERKDVIPPGESASTNPAPTPQPEQPKAGEWEVTPAGIGDIRAGMSMDEARIVMHGEFEIPANLGECGYIKPKSGPKGIMIMVEKGEISRVDVTSGSVATVQGAKIGDSEDRIKSLYPGQVEVQPHKYTDGHYLVVTPKGGGSNRLVFETDGKKVTRYRSGRLPAVQYVEGCS
jgi:hypothetical protein